MRLTDVGNRILSLLYRREGAIDPRFRCNSITWILDRDGWLTPTWISLKNYSGDSNLVRFRNDMNVVFPKNQWIHKLPYLFKYELTAHISEITDELLVEIIDYATQARSMPNSTFDRHPPRFFCGGDGGDYGWTQTAWNYQKLKAKR